MNDEQSAKLSQEMFEAKDDTSRMWVVIHWLPVLVRCLMATASRVKQLVAKLDTLEKKVERLHSEPSFKTDKARWLKANWQWIVIFLLCLKNNGLSDLFMAIFGG